MKKVLYATDCTEYSAPALRYAYRLSSAMDAQLHVLHVYSLPPITVATIRTPEQLRKRTHKEQKEIVTNYCSTHLRNELYLDPVVIKVVESSSVAGSICKTANALGASLVIVGMKDQHTTRGIFSGNIVGELLNKLNAPLLALPNDAYYHGLSTILYASDFEESDIYALQTLVSIAEPYDSLIKVVHIPRKTEQDVAAHFEQFKRKVSQRVSYPEVAFAMSAAEDVETGLHRYIKEERADMLVMLERERLDVYDRLFHKDLVRTIEAEISIPILIFDQKNIQLQKTEQKDVSYSLAY